MSSLAEKVPLVAITNGNVNLSQIGIDELFQLSLHAKENQPMKPHPCMFEKAAAHLNLPSKHILHVGDNLEKDIMGANQVGFQTAWYACNRSMNLAAEPVSTLPHVQLSSLEELLDLV